MNVCAFKVCNFPANTLSANSSCMTFEILPVMLSTKQTHNVTAEQKQNKKIWEYYREKYYY